MKNVGYTIVAILLVLVLTVVVMMWGFGVQMFGLTLGKHIENKRTDITRATNQYVTTQQTALSSLARQYRKAEERGSSDVQLQAIGNEMVTMAATIQDDQIPTSAYPIVLQYR